MISQAIAKLKLINKSPNGGLVYAFRSCFPY